MTDGTFCVIKILCCDIFVFSNLWKLTFVPGLYLFFVGKIRRVLYADKNLLHSLWVLFCDEYNLSNDTIKIPSLEEIPAHLVSTREAPSIVSKCFFAGSSIQSITRESEFKMTAPLFRYLALLSPKLIILDDILRHSERFYCQTFEGLSFEKEWDLTLERAEVLQAAVGFRKSKDPDSEVTEELKKVTENHKMGHDGEMDEFEDIRESDWTIEVWCPLCQTWIEVSLKSQKKEG